MLTLEGYSSIRKMVCATVAGEGSGKEVNAHLNLR